LPSDKGWRKALGVYTHQTFPLDDEGYETPYQVPEHLDAQQDWDQVQDFMKERRNVNPWNTVKIANNKDSGYHGLLRSGLPSSH